MEDPALVRAALLVEAIEATIVELRERRDIRHDLIADLERQRAILLAELERRGLVVQ